MSDRIIGRPFPKGQSGNPGGRPKKEWTWAGLLEEAMEEELTSTDGKKDKVKKFVTKRLVKMALDGDIAALKEVFNRMEGMPKQQQDISVTTLPTPILPDLDTLPVVAKVPKDKEIIEKINTDTPPVVSDEDYV